MNTLYFGYFTVGISAATSAICAFFFLMQKKKNLLKMMTAFTLALFFLFEVKDFLSYYFLEAYDDKVKMQMLSIFETPFNVTNFYFVCRELVQPGWISIKRLTLHLLALSTVTLSYYIYPVTATLVLTYGIAFVYLICALVIVLERRRKYIHALDAELSDDYVNIRHVDVTLILYACVILIGIPTYVFQVLWINNVWYLATSILWIALSYMIVLHRMPESVRKDIIRESITCVEPELSDKQSALPSHDFSAELDEYFLGQKPYHNPQLTLTQVASVLGTNRTYLSNYLNNELHITFLDYVNQYRMKEAVQLIREGKLCNDAIATSVGFRTSSTFYRTFKRTYGCTPSTYLKQQKPA